MNHCINCQKETEYIKFCSIECTVEYNQKNPKSKIRTAYQNVCAHKECDVKISNKRKFCDDHATLGKNRGDITLGDALYNNVFRSAAYTLVRFRARQYAINELGWCKCQKCGYDKHIEICHKKPINSFTDDTKLSIINHIDNLMALCPNCHWEFDHPVKIKKVAKNNGKCIDCGKDIKSNCRRCRDCEKLLDKTIIEWPDPKMLRELVNNTSYVAVGRLLKVNATSVKYYLKRTENGGSR